MRMSRVGSIVLALAACGDTATSVPDAGPLDAQGGFSTCEAGCRTTGLTATFGATTRVLDTAYYGTTAGAMPTLHIEVYRGAAAGCPTMTSPTPDYTLILGRVPVPTSTSPSTSPANLLDFQGDLLGGGVGAAATEVTLVPVAANETDGFVALDATLTFALGTVTGHLFATHCGSLDG